MARGWGTPSCARGLTSNAVIFQLVQTDGVKKEIRGCEERHCDGAVDGYRAEARTCALGWCGRYQGSADTPNTRAPGGLRGSMRIRLEILGLLEVF